MKIKKQYISILLALGSITFVPVLTTSCSSIDEDLLDELVSINDGSKLTNNITLSDFATASLQSESGISSYYESLIDYAIYNWYEKLATTNFSNHQNTYKKMLDKKQTEIDDEYDDTLDEYQDKNGADTPLIFQQNVLDPNGGNENAWKRNKYYDWASSQFNTDLFNNLYLSIVDNNNDYIQPTLANLNQVLATNNDTNNYHFAFSVNSLYNKSNIDTNVLNEYANFQAFIYNQWVLSQNPFVINYLQYSYSNPINGLKTIYNQQAINYSIDNTDISSSYQFPYFTTKLDNDTNNDTTNFSNFINDTITNGLTYETNSSKDNIGLTNINKNSYSENSSNSYQLIANASAYSDVDISLALASSYLFATSYSTDASGVDLATRSTLTKNVTTISNSDLDSITANFVVSDLSLIQNTDLTSNSVLSSYIPYLQLDDSYVQKILSEDAYDSLSKSSYNATNGLYTIDAFIGSDNNLNDLLFFRNEDGVYIITLDGQAYISNATSLSEAKVKAGEIVLYRYLQHTTDINSGFSVDLASSLSSFYEDNKTWLIYMYANSDNNQNLFDFSFITNDNNAKTMLDYYSAYSYNVERYQLINYYQNQANNNKLDYGQTYGVDAIKNGLSSLYPYKLISDNANSFTTINYYQQLKALKVENPFSDLNNSVSSLDFAITPFESGGIYEMLQNIVKTYCNSITFTTLTSTYKGYKYSQYIFTNDYFVNKAILAFGNQSNLMGNYVLKNILINAINNNQPSALNVNDYLNNYSFLINTFYDSNNKDVSSYINSAISNYFFNSEFISNANKWNFYQLANSVDYSSNDSLLTITYEDLDTYKRDFYIQNKIGFNATNFSEYVDFLTLIITIDYLLQNDATLFLNQLKSKLSNTSNKLSYLVWETSYNSDYQTSNSFTNSVDLLYGDGNNVTININNSYSSSYLPINNANDYATITSANNINAFNTNNSYFIDSNLEDYYYVHSSSMHNYLGLVTNSDNSKISNELKQGLFTNPTSSNEIIKNDNNSGLLYGISSSRSSLISLIDNYSSSQIINLATTLNSLLDIDVKAVTNANSLDVQKTEIKNIINDTSLITDDLFTPRNGYVNNQNLYSDLDVTNNVSYASYVIQLNSDNLYNTSTFLSYLTDVFNNNSPDGNTSNANASELANQLYWNLLVELATETNIQNNAISNLTSSYKVTVYDVRLNNQLGAKWVSNYKDKSSSS